MQQLCVRDTLFFLTLIIYFNWRLIILQYCSGFCHTLTWISHGCTCVPHPESPSHLPPYSIPQGRPSALALSAISCIALGLVVYFTYGNKHVSMLFSQIIPILTFSQNPNVCSSYLCLFCCLAYRITITIFLNSIHMC